MTKTSPQLQRYLYMVRLSAILCLLALSARAGQDNSLDDAKTLLLRVREKVMFTVNRLPHYLCTETIDRSDYQPAVARKSCAEWEAKEKPIGWQVRLISSDRLRLDVAVSGSGEMFSWVGENQFRDRSLADLVGYGATLAGTFSSFLSAIFGGGGAEFGLKGEVIADGRRLVEFGFLVPVSQSHYTLSSRTGRATVGYHGVFLVDRKTADLVQLTIRADQIPLQVGMCRADTTLNYGAMTFDQSAFLLPQSASLHIVGSQGGEAGSHTVFSGCHEFRAESSLRFDEPSETGTASATAALEPVKLPANLPFTAALTQPIATATAAAGDAFQTKLIKPIYGPHNNVLIPNEAVVNGRILRVERHFESRSEWLTLALRLESVHVNGMTQPLFAKLKPPAASHSKWSEVFGSRSRRLGTFHEILKDDVCYFIFDRVATKEVIRAGLQINGVTAAQPSGRLVASE